jgi:phage protein U
MKNDIPDSNSMQKQGTFILQKSSMQRSKICQNGDPEVSLKAQFKAD